jgi:hypothetical protein
MRHSGILNVADRSSLVREIRYAVDSAARASKRGIHYGAVVISNGIVKATIELAEERREPAKLKKS